MVAVGIESLPHVDKVVHMHLGPGGLLLRLVVGKCVNDDGDEDVEHHVRADDDKGDEEGNGGERVAARALRCRAAARLSRLGHHGIVHDAVVALASDAPHHCEHRRAKGLEIGVVVDELTMGDVAKQLDAQDGIDVEHE